MQHTLERHGAPRSVAPAPTRAPYVAHDASPAHPALVRPTWATPTREQRARALLAAWRAETRDLVQRALLREMLAHFRDACVRAGHPDPLRAPSERPVDREVAIAVATG